MAKGTVNKVLLVGRLGKDPEVRYSPSGTAVARFSLATNERVPTGGGEWGDHTEWHRIVVFGKQAEFCGNYLHKGGLVCVEGAIRTNTWEDQNGEQKSTQEIIASDVQGLSGGGDGQGQRQNSGRQQQGNRGRQQQRQQEELPPGPPNDDIPF